MTHQPLTKQWYNELEQQSASTFINLPIEFQLREYNYEFISKRYLTFFRSDDNTRQDKLNLAKKFLNFIRSVNKNRAKAELGESFFMCFEFFMNNFSDLLAKQDYVALNALDVITQAIDKSQFIEDVMSIDDLQRRVKNLKRVQEKEEVIDAEWSQLEIEYKTSNPDRIQQSIQADEKRG